MAKSGPAQKTQIVIVGGGAAGLELATKLGRRFGRKQHDIILVERNRTHIWKPLLHEVATGALDANIDEVGYRAHCQRWGYRFFKGVLDGVDTEQREVRIASLIEDGREIIAAHRIRYDYLVLTFSSVTNDFATPGERDNYFVLDSRDEADRFHESLLTHCLRVSRAMTKDPDADARVRVTIVGAGATGVELAAELYNAADALAYYGLEVFDSGRLEVTLAEAGPRILPALPEKLVHAARHELENLGVRVATGTAVTEVTSQDMLFGHSERIQADLNVWAAGLKATPVEGTLTGLETNRSDQLVVTEKLQTSRDDRIFAIGDCAACRPPGTDRLVPPRAQAAHQMAGAAFVNLVRMMEGRPLKPFVYRDSGSLVSLSRYSTLGNLMGALVGGGLAIKGRIAVRLHLALPHASHHHSWLHKRHGTDLYRSGPRDRASAAEASFSHLIQMGASSQ